MIFADSQPAWLAKAMNDQQGGGLMPMLTGAGAGLLVGGPIGAVVGGAAGLMMGGKKVPVPVPATPDDSPVTVDIPAAYVAPEPGCPGGGCGPTQQSWRCGPCERESVLEGYGYAQGPEAGAVAAAGVASGASTFRSIGLGVATGLTVWALTRFLDRHVLKGAKR